MTTQLTANEQVQDVLEALQGKAIKNVLFVACGGSSALMYPSKYLLDREAETIESDLYSSNEFIHRNPVKLGKDSLVILCSMEGKTPETVKAVSFAKSKGATTVALTHKLGSPLTADADFVLRYDWGKESNAINSNYSFMYQLVMGLLSVYEGKNEDYQKLLSGLDQLQTIYDRTREQFKEKAEQFSKEYKDEKVIYTVASGVNYGIAYSFAICILMEMQWIHSHAIHAGEYFHGPFEIIDKNVPFLILLGLDETRPLEERALKFSSEYGEKLVVLDAKDFDLNEIDETVKKYIAPLVLNDVLRLYAEKLADERNHPLSTRRYMWKVDY
ncbi:fructoselysine 6-phosphate deglycase [Scopulibacillus darangshiensis]|uniref:Fructosamine deglycase n=1 Tax=Scopulibacillus darangshiensis TaxID=442528 RepID=A0A4R2NH93_9BACL|nr:SIS domain-containing protein [Scopulibacillus darangshiensis]TCP20773.1 fructoselysine 6-phosphate deglycase [Scopulibacillus darangshiensis]